MLWNFFQLEKSLYANVTFLLERSANGIWVPSIAPQTFGNPVSSWNWSMIVYKRWPSGMLMYLSDILFLSVQTSQTMSTCFPIVEAPTLKWSAICVALWPMSKSVNDNSHNFLISNWIHALRFQEGCQLLHKIVESLITHSIVQEELSIPHMRGCTPNMCFHIASICGLFGFNPPQTRRCCFFLAITKIGRNYPLMRDCFLDTKNSCKKLPHPWSGGWHNSLI